MKRMIVGFAAVISWSVAAWSGLALAEGDAQAGKAKTAVCAGCHGAEGNSPTAIGPKLAGQNAKYLARQMQDFKNGTRSAPAMSGQLNNMSDQDIENIAAYFAGQTTTVGKASPDLVALGEQLYRSGNAETNVPACMACHSPTGKGNAPAGFPALSGQHASYIEAQLKAFRTGERKNDSDFNKMMVQTAYNLKDHEIKALASYISGLH